MCPSTTLRALSSKQKPETYFWLLFSLWFTMSEPNDNEASRVEVARVELASKILKIKH